VKNGKEKMKSSHDLKKERSEILFKKIVGSNYLKERK